MNDHDEFENLADWLGEQEFARNQSDYTDEQTTYVHVDVDVLVEQLMQSPWLAAHDERVRAEERERCAQIALGPSRSGIPHDGATGRDIAAAIRAVSEQEEN